MRVVLLALVVLFIALVILAAPEMDRKRQECQEDGGIWWPKTYSCIDP